MGRKVERRPEFCRLVFRWQQIAIHGEFRHGCRGKLAVQPTEVKE
jgi:hypothetical protein